MRTTTIRANTAWRASVPHTSAQTPKPSSASAIATSPPPTAWDTTAAAIRSPNRSRRCSRCSGTEATPIRMHPSDSARSTASRAGLGDPARDRRRKPPQRRGQHDAGPEREREPGRDMALAQLRALHERRPDATPARGLGEPGEDQRDGDQPEVRRRQQPGQDHRDRERQQRLAGGGEEGRSQRAERARCETRRRRRRAARRGSRPRTARRPPAARRIMGGFPGSMRAPRPP